MAAASNSEKAFSEVDQILRTLCSQFDQAAYVIDQEPRGWFSKVEHLHFADVGNRFGFWAKPVGSKGWSLVTDRGIGSDTYDASEPLRVAAYMSEFEPDITVAAAVKFSPDGKRVAAIGRREGRWYLIADDRRFGPFDHVYPPVVFTAGHLVFGVRQGRELRWHSERL